MSANFNTAAVSSDDSWKAQGFLNLYLPSKVPGKRNKLGAIPLKDSKPNEKELMAQLMANPELIKVLMSKLVIEYQSAEQSADSGFDL